MTDLVWQQCLENIEPELDTVKARLKEIFQTCETTRAQMDYNTGSITFSAALALYLLTRQIQPTCIFEVGTFIGKSTLAMALAIDHNGNDGRIYTCDGSNDFHLPKISKCQIKGFSKTTSTNALAAVTQANVRLDMMHIDGRLTAQDLDLIEKIADPRIVIALDDFEGMEKGVANLSMIRGRPFFAQHALIYPMSQTMIAQLGCHTGNTTALLLPMGGFTFTWQ
ncbi:MAG TPA: class I SAM-dependent methyltransferase [Terriglobales bacterium]|nr:class I SAM-dependent methyltransferase [Terriglobales bacterium]